MADDHRAVAQPSEEIRVTAHSGSRRLSLDPLAEHDVVMHARKVESSIEAGFRVQWLSGESDDVKAELCAGAGFGSPYMTLSLDIGDKHVEEVVDMRDVLPRWVDAVVAREREVPNGE